MPSSRRRSTAWPPRAGSTRARRRRSPRASSSRRGSTMRSGAGLVVEAIVENLEAKRGLFRELEAIVGDGGVLASNTSSISITALANGLARPARLVGMHFFNPVPLMKLVEVVSGVQTRPGVAEAIVDLAKRWGKTPVHARSTPGFIVNRIARPYYAETLSLLHERLAEPATIDACLRGAGFRMGPCELMDLIGHDTNFAVTESVFAANFGDKRYVPSLVQRELVDGGLLGRKSGRGFFDYPAPPPRRRRLRRARRAGRRDRRAARHGHGGRPLGRGLHRRRRALRARRVEPMERPADDERRAAPHRRPHRRAGRGRRRRARSRAVRPRRRARAAARPERRWRTASRRARRRRGATRPSGGCASPAGSRSRSATRPASSSRARSRC